MSNVGYIVNNLLMFVICMLVYTSFPKTISKTVKIVLLALFGLSIVTLKVILES